jgi:hypothetical protein
MKDQALSILLQGANHGCIYGIISFSLFAAFWPCGRYAALASLATVAYDLPYALP